MYGNMMLLKRYNKNNITVLLQVLPRKAMTTLYNQPGSATTEHTATIANNTAVSNKCALEIATCSKNSSSNTTSAVHTCRYARTCACAAAWRHRQRLLKIAQQVLPVCFVTSRNLFFSLADDMDRSRHPDCSSTRRYQPSQTSDGCPGRNLVTMSITRFKCKTERAHVFCDYNWTII